MRSLRDGHVAKGPCVPVEILADVVLIWDLEEAWHVHCVFRATPLNHRAACLVRRKSLLE